MLIIRLRRTGKKNKPTYRIVVAENSWPVDGKFNADLGFYNPHSKAVSINAEEATVWMKKGAKPSNTVAKIMERQKIKHNTVVVKANKKPKKAVEAKAEEQVVAPEAETATEAIETTTFEATEVAEDAAATKEPTEAKA